MEEISNEISITPAYIKSMDARQVFPNSPGKFGKKREPLLMFTHLYKDYILCGAEDSFCIYGDFGTRKTLLIDCLMAAKWTDDVSKTLGFKMHPKLKAKHILHFDTEQSMEDTYFNRHRFYDIIGYNAKEVPEQSPIEGYSVFNIKGWGASQKIDFIDWKIRKMLDEGVDIGLILLDQVADLVTDINNRESVNFIIAKVEEWNSLTGAIVGVVTHTNSQGTITGVSGKEWAKKVSCLYETSQEEQGGETRVRPIKGRKSPALPEFFFNQDDNAMPVLGTVLERGAKPMESTSSSDNADMPEVSKPMPKVKPNPSDEYDFD